MRPETKLVTRYGLPRVRAWWQLIREATAGTDVDYTQGSVRRAIGLLAIPMVLEMSMESVFALADIFFVSRLGAEAVAAVGLTEAVLTLVYAMAIGLSMGTTAMIARRIGEKDPDAAAIAAGQSLWVGAIAAGSVAIIGLLYAVDILGLMGAEPGVIEGGADFTTIMLAGSVTIFFIFLINGIFRGAGDASVAMRALLLANGINIVLDPLLIFGIGPFPEMGVAGAAIATTIGRGIGVLYQLYCLFRVRGRLQMLFGHLALDPAVMLRLLKVSAGGVVQFLIATSSWILMIRLIAAYGSAAIAGYTIAIRVVDFTFLPAWGLSTAAATLVGQNLGAGYPDRAERSVWLTARYNAAFLTSIAIVFIIFAEGLIRAFTTDAVIIAYGADCLRFVAYGYTLYAVGMTVIQAFNGAGDTLTPTWINFLCYWLLQIPMAYFLSQSLGYGPRGVFMALLITESLLAVVAILVFRRGRWKEMVV